MKKLIFLLLILTSVYASAQNTKEITSKSEISDVTVFIKGAQVTRKTNVNFPAGKSTVRFTNLSPDVDGKSVQIKVNGEVMILSMDYQLNHDKNIKQSKEIEENIKQIEALNEQIKLEQIAKGIIAEEINFLQENKKIGGSEGINMTNLKATSTYYTQRMSELKYKEVEIDKKLKNLSEKKAALDRSISVAGSIKPEPTGEVILNVECKNALNAPVEILYYVNNASWYPTYDIRSKNISEPIELTYKANIMQNTKEDWNNVKLKISSANPNLGNVAPKLKTYYLDYYTKPPRYETAGPTNEVRGRVTDTDGETLIGASVVVKGSTIGTVTDFDGQFSLAVPAGGGMLEFSFLGYNKKTLPISNNFMNVSLEEDYAVLEEVVVTGYGGSNMLSGRIAGASGSSSKSKNIKSSIPLPVVQIENATSVEFEIKKPYNIPSQNKNTTVELEHYSLPAEYEYYAVPKIDKDAFLLAHISDWEQYNLLEGEANVFFENTYIGKTILDTRYINDTLDISFGRDKSVLIQREKVKEYTGSKLLGSKTEVTRDWKISVKNNKKQAISIQIFDQIPVSTTNEIEVVANELSSGELDKETGEVKWRLTVEPSERQDINLKYRVKYPKGRTLTVE